MASKKQIEDSWGEAKPIRGKSPDAWRRDPYGNVIRKGSYGTRGEYGWELDHSKPKSRGGSNADRNIQPVHWEENRKKSNQYPYKKKR
jgi:5-methylcytosine-specific restriction endonuclease McrA